MNLKKTFAFLFAFIILTGLIFPVILSAETSLVETSRTGLEDYFRIMKKDGNLPKKLEVPIGISKAEALSGDLWTILISTGIDVKVTAEEIAGTNPVEWKITIKKDSDISKPLILVEGEDVVFDVKGGWVTPPDLSEWAIPEVQYAISRGVATEELQKGYKFNTTRAEFCRAAVNFLEVYYNKSIADILKERNLTPKTFADTSDSAIAAATALGITSGTDTVKNLFSPNLELTREQAAAMLKRTLDVIGAKIDAKSVAWTDAGDISSYALEAVGIIYSAGVMGGTSTNSLVFSPKSPYNHEQSVVTFTRLYKFAEDLDFSESDNTNTADGKTPEIKQQSAIVQVSSSKNVTLTLPDDAKNAEWTSSDPYIVAVDKNGKVIGRHKGGKASITAKTAAAVYVWEVQNTVTMRDISTQKFVDNIKVGFNYNARNIENVVWQNIMDYQYSSSAFWISYNGLVDNYWIKSPKFTVMKGYKGDVSLPITLEENSTKTNDEWEDFQVGINNYTMKSRNGTVTVRLSDTKIITKNGKVYPLNNINGEHSVVLEKTDWGVMNHLGAANEMPPAKELEGATLKMYLEWEGEHHWAGNDLSHNWGLMYNMQTKKWVHKDLLDIMMNIVYDK